MLDNNQTMDTADSMMLATRIMDLALEVELSLRDVESPSRAMNEAVKHAERTARELQVHTKALINVLK